MNNFFKLIYILLKLEVGKVNFYNCISILSENKNIFTSVTKKAKQKNPKMYGAIKNHQDGREFWLFVYKNQKRQILKKAVRIVNRISTKFDSAEAEPYWKRSDPLSILNNLYFFMDLQPLITTEWFFRLWYLESVCSKSIGFALHSKEGSLQRCRNLLHLVLRQRQSNGTSSVVTGHARVCSEWTWETLHQLSYNWGKWNGTGAAPPSGTQQ